MKSRVEWCTTTSPLSAKPSLWSYEDSTVLLNCDFLTNEKFNWWKFISAWLLLVSRWFEESENLLCSGMFVNWQFLMAIHVPLKRVCKEGQTAVDLLTALEGSDVGGIHSHYPLKVPHPYTITHWATTHIHTHMKSLLVKHTNNDTTENFTVLKIDCVGLLSQTDRKRKEKDVCLSERDI